MILKTAIAALSPLVMIVAASLCADPQNAEAADSWNEDFAAGRSAFESGNNSMAVQRLESAWAKAGAARDVRGEDRGWVLYFLANAYERSGQPDKAERVAKEALRQFEHRYGAQHMSVSYITNTLAGLVQNRGRYREAQYFHERTLNIAEKTLSRDDPQLFTPLNNLGSILIRLGEPKKAQPLLERARHPQEGRCRPGEDGPR